jgi:putative ubiquitin-RnfH superfamily antitoxin RatB of RatAB toxin-antitoxin module
VIRVELVRAWPRRHDSVEVELADGAQVRDALTASGWSLDQESVGLAVFGLAATISTQLGDGDRIELLRSLQVDPKQARRLRAERRRDTD